MEVTLEDLTKNFGDVVAVDEVSVKIRDGEFFVVVGPTACGKTTLLRLIAGLEKPDFGKIYFDGKLVNALGPSERGARMVFQSYALWPHMKIFDEERYSNLSFALKIRNYLTRTIRRRVEDISTKIGIERSIYPRRPAQLSEGQKQRVAVGKALVLKPKVLLMDEPLSNLDPKSRMKARQEIEKLHEDLRTTTIYVTHNLIEAMALAERMAIMREGKFIQVDAPARILKNPADDFVEDFISCYKVDLKAISKGKSK